MSFPAKYAGRCSACGERFEPEDPIDFGAGNSVVARTGAWVHDTCPEPELTAIDLRPGERVCDECFLVHPGGCDQ